MKRVSVLMLAVLMALSMVLGGCSAKGEKLLLGTWEGKVDILPLFGEMGTDEIDEYLELDDSYEVTVTMTFAKDGSYEAAFDADEMQDVFENILDAVADATVLAMKDTIQEMGATVEAYEEEIGMSLEKYVEQGLKEDINFEDMQSELEDEGEWALEGDQLTMDDDVTYTVELEKGSLTFTDCDDKDDEFFVMAEDVVFKKK